MAIDPSIALGIKPMQLDNPLNAMAQYSQIQSAQQANQLNQMKMAEYERARAEEEGVRNALAKGELNLSTPEGRAGLLKYGKTGLEYGKALTEQQKAVVDRQAAETKLVVDRTKMSRDALDNVHTPEQYLAWHEANHADPILGPALAARGITAESSRASIMKQLATPGGFDKLINQSKLGAEKFIERTTLTAGEKAVDARARERLAAETATGVLTPASLDLAANVYLQTGQLPTGLGKSAANLRSQVMNRATELSSGKNPAELASGIVDAKIDVASRGKAVKDFTTGKQGDAVRSFNTAIDHLDTMSKLATALENKDTRVFNTVGNAFAAATGSPAPTDFDTAKAIVGGEVAKALTGANMALKDREEIRDSISRANSPAQLAGSVRRLQELMGGQLNSLNLQYESSTGRKDFGNKLTPRSKEVVQELRGGKPEAQAGGLSPAEQAELEQLRARFKK